MPGASGTMSAVIICAEVTERTSVRRPPTRTVLPCQCGVCALLKSPSVATYQRMRSNLPYHSQSQVKERPQEPLSGHNPRFGLTSGHVGQLTIAPLASAFDAVEGLRDQGPRDRGLDAEGLCSCGAGTFTSASAMPNSQSLLNMSVSSPWNCQCSLVSVLQASMGCCIRCLRRAGRPTSHR